MRFELTESLWREGDAGPMLWSLRERGTLRKQRLFAVAWYRRWLTDNAPQDDVSEVIDFAEQDADGELGQSEQIFQRNYADPAIVGAPGEWAVVAVPSATGIAIYFLLEGWHDRANRQRNADLIWELFGNPFRPVTFDPAWRTTDVLLLARGIYDDRAFSAMPVLADALQEAGCENDDILAHCREADQPHARGCWVVDLILGKE